jgi:hypothetical protein
MNTRMMNALQEVFPTMDAPIHITNEILKHKYKSLKLKIFKLTIRMEHSKDPEVNNCRICILHLMFCLCSEHLP